MKESQNRIVLLLTGTINPNSFDTLSVKDPEVRKKQYIDALKYYLLNTNLNIVFTENSGTSLAQYFKENERIEFLTYSSPLTLPDKGKGYKELEIIEYSIQNSKLISKEVLIIKITGRLKILNIKKLRQKIVKQKLQLNNLVVCNVYKAYKMDSRCFLFTLDFWPILKKYGKNIDLSYSFERALWKAVCEYDTNKLGRYQQFSEPLKIKGVSGGFGVEYKHGLLLTIAKKIRHFFMLPLIYSKFRNL